MSAQTRLPAWGCLFRPSIQMPRHGEPEREYILTATRTACHGYKCTPLASINIAASAYTGRQADRQTDRQTNKHTHYNLWRRCSHDALQRHHTPREKHLRDDSAQYYARSSHKNLEPPKTEKHSRDAWIRCSVYNAPQEKCP